MATATAVVAVDKCDDNVISSPRKEYRGDVESSIEQKKKAKDVQTWK